MSDLMVEEPVATSTTNAETAESAPLTITDLLVEDVSIDGMCGVY